MKGNIIFDRNRFERVSAFCKRNGLVPQYSKIRLSQELKNGQGNYTFEVTGKNATTAVGDVALNRNDLFIPFSIGLFLQNDTNVPSGKAPLLSYPVQLNSTIPHFQKPEDVEAIYNGLLEIKMDTTVVNESFPTEVFRIVPETQPVGVVAGVVTSKVLPEFDLKDVMLPLAPEYYMQGTINTNINLSFNGNGANFGLCNTGTDATNTTHKSRVVLLMFGVLVKNGADRADDIEQVLNA